MSDDHQGCLSQRHRSSGAPCPEAKSTEPSSRFTDTNLTVRNEASEISVQQVISRGGFLPPLPQFYQCPTRKGNNKFGIVRAGVNQNPGDSYDVRGIAARWSACVCPCQRVTHAVAHIGAGLGVKMVCYSFLVGLFHPGLSAGFDRRLHGVPGYPHSKPQKACGPALLLSLAEFTAFADNISERLLTFHYIPVLLALAR